MLGDTLLARTLDQKLGLSTQTRRPQNRAHWREMLNSRSETAQNSDRTESESLAGGEFSGFGPLETMVCCLEEPKKGRSKPEISHRYAAFVSRSVDHFPRLASPFISARWEKAACAAATFSSLPAQAFCGAACKARP